MDTERHIVARLMHDDEPINPRTEYDNLGTMVCWHSRYVLGDEMPRISVDEWMRELAMSLDASVESRIDYWKNGRGWQTLYEPYDGSAGSWNRLLEQSAAKQRDVVAQVLHHNTVMLDLYLYDHSGITMNTGGFSCPWDSGQVGFIYVTRQKIKEEYGWRVLTKARRAKIEEYLRNEVATYAQCLEGDVWGYEIVEREECKQCGGRGERKGPHGLINICRSCNGTGEVDGLTLDSCWGFYGADPRENGMIDNAGSEYAQLLIDAYHER